jgi:hypothetical protein
VRGEGALERRYRRLLAWYPAAHRGTYGEELIGVLLAAAPGGSSRPGLAAAFDLIRGGLRVRFRSAWRRLTAINWPDALAVCSVAVPVLLLGYFTTQWLYILHSSTGPLHAQVARGLVVLAIAAPPLLALRFQRTAAVIAVAQAGWLSIFVIGSALRAGDWLIYGNILAGSVALMLEAAALAWSLGPRRGAEILTPNSWLVLIGSGIAMGLIHPYLWPRPIWVAAVIVIAVLALFAAGLLLTIPRTAARGLLLLLAAPAYPGAVWAIGLSGPFGSYTSGFPSLVFLPTVLLACLAAAASWRSRCRSAA